MAVSEAVSRSIIEAESLFANDAAPASDSAPASSSSSSGSKTVALLVAMLLTLGSVGVLGYTQWWVPRERAQEIARVTYQHCLNEVKVYRHKHTYKDRLAQCIKFVSN